MEKEIAQYLTLNSTLVSREVQVVPEEEISPDKFLNILTFPISDLSPAIEANSYYFNQREWAKGYFENCHRYQEFKVRWQAVMGSWDDKIVVDIGCGPGNLYASLNGSPRVLIGVDVSLGALEMAAELGYTAVLADAHHLPFVDGFADIVAINATLHHCENMSVVLTEAARLVRPGGILVIDHDPQLSAWDYKGLGMFLYNIRLMLYRFFLRSLHINQEERSCMLATEIHHKPGDGVTAEFFRQTLEPLGFTLKLYPHNNTAGAEVLEGDRGKPPHWRYRINQRLSGIDPNTPEAALSLMCVATRNS
jgi:ubiquinone/menaquinone biosynthesis C-methylase UbiE